MESAFHGHERQHRPLQGLVPATVVPMMAGGQIDWPGLRRYLQWVAAQNPIALAVTADTAEVGHLTHGEQLRIVETAKQATGLPCIAGLTASPVEAAVARAEELRRAGAVGLLIFPSPDADIDVVGYHRAVGQVLPLIAFHLQPALGGVRYPADLLGRLLAEEAVVAVKEASFDRGQFAAVAAVARQQHVTLLTGNDNFILESFRLGADGALLGFGAVLTGEQVAMIDAWGDGRVADAEAYAARLQPLADAVFAPPVDRYRVRLKECLAALGILAGAHVRPPGQALDEPERARLHAVLRHAVGAGVGR